MHVDLWVWPDAIYVHVPEPAPPVGLGGCPRGLVGSSRCQAILCAHARSGSTAGTCLESGQGHDLVIMALTCGYAL